MKDQSDMSDWAIWRVWHVACTSSCGTDCVFQPGVTLRLISARLIISLIVGITLVSLAFSYYEVQVEKSNLRHDLERRAEVLGESLAGNVERPLEKGATRDLQRIVERFGNREHLLGIAVYDPSGNSLAVTPGLGHRLVNTPLALDQALIGNRTTGNFVYLGSESAHVYTLPLHRDNQVIGVLATYKRAPTPTRGRQSFPLYGS